MEQGSTSLRRSKKFTQEDGIMPPLYESARNDFIVARKDRNEAAEGFRDVLRADSQFLRGEIGLTETLRREGSGIVRAVSGSLGNIFHSGMAAAESAPYGGILPALTISEGQQSGESCGDNIRQIKKEKASYLESQQNSQESG